MKNIDSRIFELILTLALIIACMSSGLLMAQSQEKGVNVFSLEKALKDSMIALNLEIKPLGQNDSEGSSASCRVAVQNKLPIEINLYVAEFDPPVRVFIRDLAGKSVGTEYEVEKINSRLKSKSNLEKITIKAGGKHVYEFILKNNDEILKLSTGSYTGYALLPVFIDPENALRPILIRSKMFDFEVKNRVKR